jgi:hypothetical protein
MLGAHDGVDDLLAVSTPFQIQRKRQGVGTTWEVYPVCCASCACCDHSSDGFIPLL